MSGALVKVGIYGLIRAALLVGAGTNFGMRLMVLGAGRAVFGITLALLQRDLKRVLAYSTVENVGIILTALGLGFWARARGEVGVAALAWSGGFLHVWNHAAMKGLMFLGAGNVLHGTGTRDMERLGGLLRRMPLTGRAMIVGSVAIAALPPLNGFPGEWLLYGVLTRVGASVSPPANLAAMAAAAASALTGGLALLCFVRLFGTVFFGTPRASESACAHDPSWIMTVPPWILAAACFAGALATPTLVRAQFSMLVQLGCAQSDLHTVAGLLSPLALLNALLLVVTALGMAWLLKRGHRAARSETWGCGYLAPNPRMQYTARAFSELLGSLALPRWLRPVLRTSKPEGLFPTSGEFASEVEDPITRDVYEPLLVGSAIRFARLRFLQQGRIHIYHFYILAATVVGLVWAVVWDGWLS